MSATICLSPNAPDPTYIHAHTTVASKISHIRRQSFPKCSHETHTVCVTPRLYIYARSGLDNEAAFVCTGPDGFITKESDWESADFQLQFEKHFLKYLDKYDCK